MFRFLPWALVLAGPVGLFAQAPLSGSLFLDSDHPIQVHLTGGESSAVQIHANAGDYLRVIAAADSQLVVKTWLFDPTGKLVAVTPSLGGTGGTATIAAYAPVTGDFRLKIASQMMSREPRICTVTLAERRPAGAKDRTDAQAHEAFAKVAAEAAQSRQGMRAALAEIDRPIELARAAGDDILEMRAVFGKGQFVGMLGNYETSLTYLGQALELCRKAGDKRAEAHTLDDLGLITANLERYPQAIEYYNQALDLQRQTGQPWETALTLANLADSESALGRIDLALEDLRQQEQIRKSIKDEFGLNETWLGMAKVYLMTGDPQRAIEKLLATLPHWRKFYDKEDGKESEIETYRMLGLAYVALGDDGSAETALRNAMQRARALGNPRIIADTLVVQAQVAVSQHASARSMEVVQNALAASRRAQYQRGEALALIELAKLRITDHEFRQARSSLTQAIAISTKLQQPYDEANARRELGIASADMRDATAAEEQYSSALAIERRIGDRYGEVQTLVGMARLQDGDNQPAQALQTLDRALEVIDHTRSSLAAPELRASYLASQRDAYELTARVLVRLDRKYPGRGYDAQAFDISERAHARTLLDALGESSSEFYGPADHKLTVQRDAVDAALHSLAISEDSGRREERIAQLLATRKQLEIELASERAGSGRGDTSTRPLPLESIRREALTGNAVLLEYLTGPQQTHLWVVSRSGLHHFSLPPEAIVAAAVQRLYDSLTADSRMSSNLTLVQRHAALEAADRAARGEAELLGRTLLPMPASMLGKGAILVVGDGPVQLVPFALLPTPGDSTRRLGSAHGIAFEPSASVLAQLHEAHRANNNQRVLIVADPVYNRSDPRFGDRNSPGTLSLTGYRSTSRSGDLRIDDLPPLPMSHTEAQQLASLANGRAITLLDFNATRSSFERLARRPYSIIHIATHAMLDDRHPDLSGLVMSMVNRTGQRVDGFVPLLDIYKMHLDANLVVLSACDTFVGDDLPGEGLRGLARGFLYAGARQVVASLWRVDDRATAIFMQRFYTALLRDRIGSVDALARAQNEMSKDPAWSSPRYWAGFVLEGDPR